MVNASSAVPSGQPDSHTNGTIAGGGYAKPAMTSSPGRYRRAGCSEKRTAAS